MNAVTDTAATAKQIAESIAALPPLPVTAQEILTCFGDEFIDADKVATVVEGDPGICAKLLGLANSAYFGVAEPVTNMSDAITWVLGVDTVRSLVLAMAIQQSFNSRKCPAFEPDRFWVQSLLMAECCKKIVACDAEASDGVRDLAYSAGLCYNLGLMALAHMEPQRTNDVLSVHREKAQPGSLSKLLLDEFSTDHRIVTAELARFWSLPEPMIDAYSYRGSPTGECKGRLAAVIFAGATLVSNREFDEERRVDIGPWARILNLTVDELQKMAVFGERQRERVRSLAGNMTY